MKRLLQAIGYVASCLAVIELLRAQQKKHQRIHRKELINRYMQDYNEFSEDIREFLECPWISRDELRDFLRPCLAMEARIGSIAPEKLPQPLLSEIIRGERARLQ